MKAESESSKTRSPTSQSNKLTKILYFELWWPKQQQATMVKEVWKAHGALVLVQLLTGGYYVITKVALIDGVNQLIFCVCRDILAVSILAPIAYVREKYLSISANLYILLPEIFIFFFANFDELYPFLLL